MVIGIGPNPDTSFNPSAVHQIEEPAVIQEFVRIVGDLQLGPNS